jgi:hypothetical protein
MACDWNLEEGKARKLILNSLLFMKDLENMNVNLPPGLQMRLARQIREHREMLAPPLPASLPEVGRVLHLREESESSPSSDIP